MLANRLQATASLLNRLAQRAQIGHRKIVYPLARGEGGFCRTLHGYNSGAGGA